MFRRRGRRKGEKFLELTNAKLPPLRERAKDADTIQIREGFGDGKDVSHGNSTSVVSPKDELVERQGSTTFIAGTAFPGCSCTVSCFSLIRRVNINLGTGLSVRVPL